MEKFYMVNDNDLASALNIATYDELGQWLRNDCAHPDAYVRLAKNYFPTFPEKVIRDTYYYLIDLWHDNERDGFNNPDGTFKGGYKVTEIPVENPKQEAADAVSVSDIISECVKFYVDGGFSDDNLYNNLHLDSSAMDIDSMMAFASEKTVEDIDVEKWAKENPGKIERVAVLAYGANRFESIEELVNYSIRECYKGYLVDFESDFDSMIASLYLYHKYGIKRISRKIWDEIAEKICDMVEGYVDYGVEDIRNIIQDVLIAHEIKYAAV